MKSLYYLLNLLLIIGFFGCANPDDSFRKKLFDDGWSFYYGDLKDEKIANADTTGWRQVDLPHDWSVEMPFIQRDGGIAVGHTQGGIGWYKKTFSVAKNDSWKRKILYFEGVYMESEVWINGQKISFHPYGYTSFFCDITDFLNPAGKDNVIAVKAKNEGRNSRWYSGSGIYRHVWLITTDKLHLDEWNVFITTNDISLEKAMVNVAFDVFNECDESTKSQVTITLKDDLGKVVASQKVPISLNPKESKTINESVSVTNPKLWSLESTSLYTAEISLESNGKIKDALSIPFGIRSISFSADEGFQLNGKTLKLKGGCIHHDNGLLGAVALDRAEERKVELLKANGFNAVRCAHNPPSEKFLEACDRLGILVIDEAFDQWQKQKNPNDYHRFFDEWHEKDIASMVLRDRNHPSIIMWSIGNEIQERSDSSGVEIARKLKSIVKKYDDTRPITSAVNDYWDNPQMKWKTASPTAFKNLNVCGYNYMWWEYENDAKSYPNRVFFGSETTPMERTVNWDLVEKYPQIIGDFIWTAMDYLGESGIGHALLVKDDEKDPPMFLDRPWFNAWCGDIDILGNRKPQAALRDVLWNNSKIEMLVHSPIPDGYREKTSYWGWPDEDASWNWKGFEGRMMEVKVYTRYPSVRLYLNGKQIAQKETEKTDKIKKYSAEFQVKYEPGELKAVGIGLDGEKESVIIETTGNPVKIKLTADHSTITNSKNNLSYVTIELVDKDGKIVTDNDIKVDLSVSGNGKLLASGNACPYDMESFRSKTPKTYKGKALAIVQPFEKKGKIILQAKTEKYGTQSISLTVD